MAKFVRTLALLGLLGVCVAATPAMAAAVYFGEDLGAGSAANMPNSIAARTSFLSNLASYGVEGLESVTTTGGVGSTSTLNFGATGVTGALSFLTTVRSVPFNARFAAEGSNYLDTSFNRRITFNTAAEAFGLFVIDANELNNNPASVTVNGQTLTQAEIEARPFDSVDGIFRIVTERAPGVFELLFDLGTFPALDSSAMFVGLIDAANPFTNIILINGASGLDNAFQDGFGYDGLIVGSLPEPGTLVLLGFGLAGLAASRRRRQ
ncbi:MAG: PEP-CTERM sorting domain-containing protein [Proteobacteria bacterium]|nr:PEP-CTERM sorting domain-containing protein [Pseudomonadota bacterium]